MKLKACFSIMKTEVFIVPCLVHKLFLFGKSTNFPHVAKQIQFATILFQWGSHWWSIAVFLLLRNGQPISNCYFKLCTCSMQVLHAAHVACKLLNKRLYFRRCKFSRVMKLRVSKYYPNLWAHLVKFNKNTSIYYNKSIP